MALTKDIFVFDQMYDMNLDFYKELTMYIIAGKKALGQAKSTKLVELQERLTQPGISWMCKCIEIMQMPAPGLRKDLRIWK